MGLVTALAIVDLQGKVFKHKRALLVGMTSDTTLLPRQHHTAQRTTIFPVRIVAIGTIHRPFQDRMMVRLLKLGPGSLVTAHAQVILFRLQQSKLRFLRMHLMTGDTGDIAAPVS